MKRIALMSSSFVSILSFANPEKGDPNSGMFILLYYILLGSCPIAINPSQ